MTLSKLALSGYVRSTRMQEASNRCSGPVQDMGCLAWLAYGCSRVVLGIHNTPQKIGPRTSLETSDTTADVPQCGISVFKHLDGRLWSGLIADLCATCCQDPGGCHGSSRTSCGSSTCFTRVQSGRYTQRRCFFHGTRHGPSGLRADQKAYAVINVVHHRQGVVVVGNGQHINVQFC